MQKTVKQQQQHTELELQPYQERTHATLMYLPVAAEARAWLEQQGIYPAAWRAYGLGFDPALRLPTEPRITMPAIIMPWMAGNQVRAMHCHYLEPVAGQTSCILGADSLTGLLFGGQALDGNARENKTLLVVEGEVNALTVYLNATATNLDVLAVTTETTSLPTAFYARANEYWQCLFWVTSQALRQEAGQQIQHGYQVNGAGKPTANELHQRGQLSTALARIRLQAARTPERRQELLNDFLHAADTHPLGVDAGSIEVMQQLATRFVYRQILSEVQAGRFVLGLHAPRLRTVKTVFPVKPEQIPQSLKDIPQWVGYQLIPKPGGKTDKIPKNPHTSGNAGVTFPGTWGDFLTTLDFAYHADEVDGVALVLTGQDNLVVVDIDDCIQPDGSLSPLAQEVVALLDSYTEISPSGRGIHIFVYGELPGPRRRSQAHGIEMYDAARFMTVTGYHYPHTPDYVQARAEAISTLYTRIFGETAEDTQSDADGVGGGNDADIALWQKVFNGHKGDKLQKLFEGDIAVCNNDASQAVIELGNALAYYTAGDAAAMRRLFHQTQLVRPKWEEKRGETTWLDFQIADCIAYIAQRQQPTVAER